METKTAIIIGASSGIGAALADALARNGYRLGLVARRIERLERIKDKLDTDILVQEMDISSGKPVQKHFESFIEKMGHVDLVVISAGIGHINHDLDLTLEQDTIDTNATGFITIANTAFQYFSAQKKGGHIVGISSIAALRGNASAPAYNASKAFYPIIWKACASKHSKTALILPFQI